MRTGQFFTLALIIFSGIVLTAVAFTNSFNANFGSDQIAQAITDHTDHEISHAVGAAAASGQDSTGQLLSARAFSGFREYTELQRGIETDSRYVIGTPTDTGITISVTNMGNSPLQQSWLVIDGTERFLGTVPADGSNTTTFSTTADRLTVTWNGTGLEDYSQTFRTPRKTFIFHDSASAFGSSIFSDAVLY